MWAYYSQVHSNKLFMDTIELYFFYYKKNSDTVKQQ